MAIKLVEYTYDKSVGDCTPTLTPNTITMTKSDSTNGNIVTRTISVDSLPTAISFNNNQALLSLTYLDMSNLTSIGHMVKDCRKIKTVEISNQTAPNLTNMIHTFYNCSALTSIKLTNVNFTNSKGVQLQEMCRNCTSLTEFSVTGEIKVNNFNTTFYNCNQLTSISLTAFDVSSCQTFNSLFDTCVKLETIDMSNWNTSSATSFHAMFLQCKALTSLDLRHFNIDNVTSVSHMFGFCDKLTSLNIQNWNTSKIESFAGTFKGLKSMPNSFWDLSWMDVSGAKDISYIFEGNVFTEIPNIHNWNTHNVTNFGYMFSKCANLTNVDLTFLDTSNLINCLGLFSYCTNLTSFNINNWNTSNCGKLNEFVRDCTNLENLDGMKNIDITKVRDYGYFASNCTKLKDISLFENIKFPVETSLYFMLYYCRSVENWEILSTWDVSNVFNMTHLLDRTNITSLEPIRNWDVSSVINMEGFLSGVPAVLSLEPIRNWDVSEVKNLTYFIDSSKISDVSPIKNWKTPKLESVANMLAGCKNLITVDLSNWITSNVTNMRGLFNNCSNLESVNLSNWDSSKAPMSGMFNGCNKLKYIDLSSFDTGSASVSFYQVFQSCSNLETLDLSNFRIINNLDTNGTFNGCTKLSKIALLYSTASDINTLMSRIKPLIAKEVKVYYYDADPTQLTPIDGVTYIKYEFPTTTSLPPHINLYSLPDGTKDELDVKTGILSRKIGVNDDGSLYKLDEPKQEKVILNYNHSCDYGMVLPKGAVDRYDVLNSKYHQNIASVHFDGTDTWHNIEELDKCVKIGIEGVDALGIKAGGGLYCDNDLFPNIDDNSDTEHCRVDPTTGGKFYFYIDKNRLSSPDLIGWQIWLQQNPFTMYFEVAETRVLDKPYKELNPELASWDMMDVYNGGYLETTYNTETGIYPIVDYQAKSTNNFYVPTLENNTTYTVYANATYEKFDVYLGGSTYSLISGKTYTSGGNNWLRFSSYRISENLYNKETATIGIYVADNGVVVASSNDVYSDYISIKPSTNYSYKIYSNVYHNTSMAWYDSNKTFIKRVYVGSTNSTTTFLSPSNASYVRVGNNNFSNVGGFDVGYALYEGDTCPDIFEDYKQKFYYDDVSNMMLVKGDTTDEVVPYFTGVNSVVNPSVHVINKNILEISDYDKPQSEGGNVARRSENGVINFVTDSHESYATFNLANGEWLHQVASTNSINIEYAKAQTLIDKPGTYTFSFIPTLNSGEMRVSELIIHYDDENFIRVSDVREHFDTKISKTFTVEKKINYVSMNFWYYGNAFDLTLSEIQIEKGNTATSYVQGGGSKITTNVVLRSSENGVKDSYNVVTGEHIQRVDENLQVLENPIKTTLEPQELLAYEDGQILLSSESGMLPTMIYSLPSSNAFRLPSMRTGTRYTLKYPSASGSIGIGEINYKITGPSMLFTTPLTIKGDTSSIVFTDDDPQDVMLIEGDYSKREIPFFTGMRSSENIVITTRKDDANHTVQTQTTLRALPNGAADKLDLVSGQLLRVTGIRNYQEGDLLNRDVFTDQVKTIYPLSTPTVTTLNLSTPMGYAEGNVELSSDALIPTLRYRLPSSNNFILELLKPDTRYTLYANYEQNGSFTLGGTLTQSVGNAKVITTSDTLTDSYLTFDGDLGLSNVMLIEGDSREFTVPYFNGLLSVENAIIRINGSATEVNRVVLPNTVKLRSLHSLMDELDLVTGVYTKRIESKTLTGDENWQLGSIDTNQYISFKLVCQDLKTATLTNLYCDRFNSFAWTTLTDQSFEFVTGDGTIEINIRKDRLTTANIAGFKRWLKQYPTTIHYELTQPNITTLTLPWTTKPISSFYGNTTIQTSVSQSLKPYLQVIVATTTLEEVVSDLKVKNAALEEENLSTMMAVTEVFEMMMYIMPSEATTINIAAPMTADTRTPKGGFQMVEVYVTLIIKGKKTLEQVPAIIRPQVEAQLIELGVIEA